MSRAARELASVQDKKLDGRMRSHVNHSLAHLYSELHEVEKGRAHFERWIAETGGCNRCALEEYAQFLFFTADDLDGAVATVRQSRKLGEPGEADSFLYAQVLLAKAAKLYENKQLAEATRVVKEVQLAVPGIERDYARLAYLPKSLPGIFALKDAGLVRDFSGSVGGLALVYASRHASAADVERLIRERANPNYFSPEEGAPLSTALMGRNLPALKVLLAHGADMSVRNRQGQLPLEWAQMVLRPSDPRDAEILATVRAAAKDLPGAEPVEGPLKSGYVYEARKKISEYQGFGHDMEAGTRLTFHDYCNYTNPDVTCLRFRHPTIGFARIDIALQKVQLVSWQEWFKEIGPAPAQGK